MDLTNEDVADILALLDSLPYDSLDVETPRLRLTLRRAPGGGWTEESQVLADATVRTPPPNVSASSAASPDIPEMSDGASAAGTGGRTAAAGAGATRTGAAAGAGAAAAAGTGAAAAAQTGAAAGEAQAGDPGGFAGADGLAVVAAPLPGTFYRAPRPGADPFVQSGDLVSPDTVVAIVETMKLMNSVHAGTAGRVARICCENGAFAAAGTPLMLIEPDA